MKKQQFLKRFRKLTEKMYEIAEKKNSDYSHGDNPFKNFEAVERLGIMTEHGFLTRIMDKVMRIANIVEKGEHEVKDESVEDTLIDLSNYSLLFKLWLEGGNNTTCEEQSNEVIIGNKAFSWLRPEPNGVDVFSGPEGYEHVKYIKGDAIEKYLGDYKMFAGKNDFEEFIENNIEGETGVNKLKTFADLMGMQFWGYRHPDGEFGLVGGNGYAWVSRSDGVKAYEFCIASVGAVVCLSNLEFAQPIVVYRDIYF